MHLIFCAHLLNIFEFLQVLNLDIFFPSEMCSGCLVCVICNSNSFHSFMFKLHNDCSYIEDVHLFCIHFMIFFSFLGVLNLDMFSVKCQDGVWFV